MSDQRGSLCGKLHGGQSQLLFALQQSLIGSQLVAENRDLCLPHLHSTPRWGGVGSRRNIAMTFNVEKLEWCGYLTVKIFCRYVYSFRQNVRT